MREFVVELKQYNSEYMRAANVFFYDDIGKIPDSIFVAVSPTDAIQIRKILYKELLLLKNNLIPKTRYDHFPEVTFSMFERTKTSSFELRKLNYIRGLDSRINYTLSNISAIELFEYYVIITSFAEKGIIINDANREEKYLEIVSSADENLIILLERYLEIKDKIDEIYRMYNQIVDAKKILSQSTDEKQLDESLKQINPYHRKLEE